MALPIKGQFRARLSEPYAGAEVWGTGINPVHAVYGEGPPLRTGGRNNNVPTIQPIDAKQDETTESDFYHFPSEDMLYLSANPNDAVIQLDYGTGATERPDWGEQPPGHRGDASDQPPWNAPQSVNENFRSQYKGARHRWIRS